MMTPLELNEYLCCLRANHVMQASLKLGDDTLSVTFAPEFEQPKWMANEAPATQDPAPGAWKQEPSDPDDPDPLGLGPLDAPLAYDAEVIE